MARGLKNQIVPYGARGVLTPSASRRMSHQTGAVGVTRVAGGLRGLGEGVEATSSAIFNQARYVDPSSISPYPGQAQVNIVEQSSIDSAVQARAVKNFSNWLKNNFPKAFKAVVKTKPELLIPDFALAGLGGLSFRRRLAGLGEVTTDTVNADTTTADTTTDTGGTISDTTPSTSWGTQISDFLTKLAGPLAATYEQQQLMAINVKRAEMGLPPLDSTTVAPTVNVGIPPAQMEVIKNIGMVVAVGMVGLGALYMMKRGRK